jgi:dTDP-4-dehydrorhamnose reductase
MDIWLTGATGLLGGWARAALEGAGHVVHCERVDLEDEAAITRAAETWIPRVVVHCAAISAIADCAKDPAHAWRVNADATAVIARACGSLGARLVHVSTDLVFDGEGAPYAEDASLAPISVYGTTKAEAERAARIAKDVVIARMSLLYGPTRTARRGFFDAQIEALRTGKPLTLFDDEWRTPLSLRAAAAVLVRLVTSDVRGVLHVAGPERMSRLEMGRRLAAVVGVTPELHLASRTSVPGEPRARDLSMDTARLRSLFGEVSASFEDECRAMLA